MKIFQRIRLPILILLISEVVLIGLFPASLIFKSNVTAGGDTPSHFISAIAMSRGLWTFFSPVAWLPGAYGGFPLFLQYFPLPFAIMALISLAVSLQVAFKLVTLLAILPLPAAAYLCLRRLGYAQNTAEIGAVLSLPFLFMTENSMWGGNIDSTLAGEFAFGISLILYVIFTGKLYADISEHKSLWGSSALEALMALSSGYPLLQSAMGTSYFLVRGGKLRYLLQLHAAAFGLAAFWLLPVLWRIPWNSAVAISWGFKTWTEFAPPILWPSFAGVLMVPLLGIDSLFRRKTGFAAIFKESIEGPELYLFWQFAVALLAFSLAPSAGLVDIRFLPFAQIMAALLGAIGWGRLLSRLPRPNLWFAVFSAGIVALSLTRVAAINTWIQWNYSGMDSKPLSNSYRLVNQYLRGDQNSPRVVYEHNEITNAAGTSRAFELLPYYSGRSTLEGLYLQSSISAPFVFYIQSELTQTPSTPLSRYYYSRPDPGRAAAHLRLFNVGQVIAASSDIASALDYSPDYEFGITFPPYRIYRLKEAADSYVEPLRFKPLRIPPKDWKRVQFDWFRKSSLRVPLIVASQTSPGNFWRDLQPYDGDPGHIPEVPYQNCAEVPGIRASARLDDGKIAIETSEPGHPLWIKVSYHPDWRISEGAGELYQASPAFMVLVPRTSRVVLTFDTRAGVYLWGKILSLLTLALLVSRVFIPASFFARVFIPNSRFPLPAPFFFAFAVMAIIITATLSVRNHRDSSLLYELANSRVVKINEETSAQNGQAPPDVPAFSPTPENLRNIDLLNECIAKFGHSSVLDFCMLDKASSMYALKRWASLRSMLEDFLRDNPDTRVYAESLMWLGKTSVEMGRQDEAEGFFRRALFSWPPNNATKQAGLSLVEMIGTAPLLKEAKGFLESGKYLEAYSIYGALALSGDKNVRDESVLSLAYCSFDMNRTQEASDLFLQWLNNNFEAPESVRVQAAFRQCQTIIARDKEWLNGSEPGAASPGDSGFIVRFLNWAGLDSH